MTNETNFHGKAALGRILEAASSSLSSGSALRAIILKALTDPNIHHGFDELKSVVAATVEKDGSLSDGKALLNTLDLFSFGTLADFKKAPDDYLRLSEAQLAKLRQLTVLSAVQEVCARGRDSMTYSEIAQNLDFPDDESGVKKLEECIVSCVYSDLVSVRLCQKSKLCRISTRAGPPCQVRDVRLSDLPLAIDELKKLQHRIKGSRNDLESSKQHIKTMKVAAHRQREAFEQEEKQEAMRYKTTNVRNLSGWENIGASVSGSSTRRQTKRNRGALAAGSNADSHQRC
eukprot:CAMPEP_0119568170 /NCGR_PEP_ID=MMETSP1352-20130426/38112_1 /TAXON_ID=265584 /ORGANISM="Stauroneis constricta, Strain CCMP1120" /LENGTH=287 /DNA_ID=CAMNT_0007617525 /DNA_START=16 /DNA_END=879 /DNA_ORIENTATION=+